MSFETTSRIIMVPASMMEQVETYRQQYGELCPVSAKPNAEQVLSLLGHLDGQSGIIRAGQMPTSVSARKLTNGKYAVSGYWTVAVREAWENGDIEAEEITSEQLQNLTPAPEL